MILNKFKINNKNKINPTNPVSDRISKLNCEGESSTYCRNIFDILYHILLQRNLNDLIPDPKIL